jgi:PBP1b-binding outer membrane lipoprotein LpoB
MRIEIMLMLIILCLALASCTQENNAVNNTEQATSQVASQISSDVFPNNDAAACPRGVENDPAPGACFQYTDLNSDGLCDLG